MNITLTSKDANSIIHWIREELQGISDLKEDIINGFKHLRDTYENSENLKNSEKCTDEINETKTIVDERLNELDNDRLTLLHFIELLTCGSEVSV